MTPGQLRTIAYARSRGLCEHCGRPLPERWELHHRRPGGMGGTKRPGQQEPSNVLALIPEHHNLDPTSVHLTAASSRHYGWLVRTHHDPAEVPVLLWGKTWALLDGAGGWAPCEAPAA